MAYRNSRALRALGFRMRPARRQREIETQEQIEVVRWLKIENDARIISGEREICFIASSNGGKVSKRQAVLFKAMGYRAGTPDLFILWPRGGFHGLFIEMKRPAIPNVCDKGRPSKEQIKFAQEVTARGYGFYFAYGADEAKRLITEYIARGLS